jgi:maltodextrin utilization protein YvdJ
MKLQELKIDVDTMTLEVDVTKLKGSFAVVVCDGKAKLAELPQHGETKIITHQGKVKRVKFDEGEEF